MAGGAPSEQRPAGARGPEQAPPPATDGAATAAPVDRRPPEGRDTTQDMPRVRLTRRQLVASAVFVLSVIAFLYLVLPKILGLKDTWNRIQHGDPWWLAISAAFEALSFLSYILLFRAVFIRDQDRIGIRVSYEITMAGLAATRVFASAGAGGIALTAWALRRAGLEPRLVACRMIAFNVLVYAVFMGTLVLCGLGLYLGVIPGGGSFAITVVPALFGAIVIAIVLAISLVPGDFDRLVARWVHGGRVGRLARQAAAVPAAAASGVRTAIALVRSREPGLLGAVGWWGFDIAVLWACFHAFGASPPVGVVVMSYFVGMIGNLLPLPGGIGGVDGALIGSFSAFGVSPSLAVVAVLAYRAFAFWLPTLPGGVAYLQLRRTVARWRAEGAPSYT